MSNAPRLEDFSEDEILRFAEKIRAKRMAEEKVKSFLDAKVVTVRWDIPLRSPLGISYIGVNIPKDLVEGYIVDHFRDGEKNV